MLPTGPFPDIVAPANLYASTRRRASHRKARTATAVASVAALLAGGAGYAALHDGTASTIAFQAWEVLTEAR